MKSRLFLILIFLLLPVAASASDAWTRVSSKNFVLVGQADKKEISRMVARLEQFRETLQNILPVKEFNSAPTTVFVFKSNADLQFFQSALTNGKSDDLPVSYLQPDENIGYLALTAGGDSKIAFESIFHDYVHLIINKNFGRAAAPPWVNEGLAEYFQNITFENEQNIRLGSAAEKNLRLLTEQNLISLERLFAFDYYTLRNQGNHGQNIFYAESWALMHYLQQGDKGKRREQFKTFLNLLINGKVANEAFAEAFQTDLTLFEKELKNYIAERSFTNRVVSLKDKPNFVAEMQLAVISEAEANVYKADLLRSLNRVDEAANLLRQSIKLSAKNASAYISLGAALADQNKFDEAQEYFQKAIALDPQNHLSYFYYADTLRRETVDENFVRPFSDEKTIRMRELLRRAIELNPNSSASHRLLAFVNFANNADLNDAIKMLDKALAFEPGNEQYTLDLGRIYYRQEKFDQARTLARKIFASAEDATVRADAQILLNNVNSLEEQLRQIRERNARQNKGEQLSPIQFSEEELINQSLNEALRKPKTGEKRVVGYLSNVVCDGGGINFVVLSRNQAEDKTFKFHSNDFLSVALMAFTAEASGKPIGCGARNPQDFVVVNYRPPIQSKTAFDGEIVSVEFVPETFKLQP